MADTDCIIVLDEDKSEVKLEEKTPAIEDNSIKAIEVETKKTVEVVKQTVEVVKQTEESTKKQKPGESKTEKPDQVKEDEDDIPENFFDDFSNNEFMDGLNVLDSWDENQTQEKRRDSPDKRRSRERRSHRASPVRRSSSRNRYDRDRRPARRGRYCQIPGRRRSNSPRPRRSRPRVEERRDPNKNRNDVQRDKDKVKRMRDAKEVEKTVQVAETGLCPPGMEDMIDEVQFNQIQRPSDKSNEQKKSNSKDRKKTPPRQRRRSRSRERKRTHSRERRRSPYRFHRRGRSPNSHESDRETWLRQRRSLERSGMSPESKRIRMEMIEETRRAYERNRRRRSSDRFRRRSRSRSNSFERAPRRRSPFLHELARTLCNKPVYPNSQPSQDFLQPQFSLPSVLKTFPMDVQQQMVSTQIVQPQIISQQIPPAMVPPAAQIISPQMAASASNDGFNFPSVHSFPAMEQSFSGMPFSQEFPRPVQAPVFSKFDNISAVEMPLNIPSKQSGLQARVRKESPPKSALQISKLFEDKKISLSDFLSVSAKGEALPSYVQEKIKVISRCQEAIKNLENIGKISGRFIPKPRRFKDSMDSPTDEFAKSPLKKQLAIKFRFTSINKRKSKELSQTMNGLLTSLNLPTRESFTKSTETSLLILNSTHNAFIQTDPYECQDCEERKHTVYCTVGTQTNIETATEGTQVTPNDLAPPAPPRSILKNSLTHLTAAQLREDRNVSPPKGDSVYNPFVGTSSAAPPLLATPMMTSSQNNMRSNNSPKRPSGLNPWGDSNAGIRMTQNFQKSVSNSGGNNNRGGGGGGKRGFKNNRYKKNFRPNNVDIPRRYN